MIIYQITNLVNKKRYIGQTNFSLDKRMNEHKKQSQKEKPTQYIHRAMKKYGFENFIIEPICECKNQNELDAKEKKCIKKWKTLTPKGYNMLLEASGGDLFTNHPDKEEIRKRISEGTKHGIAHSKKSWSESHKGSKNGMYGRKHSPESIAKMKRNRQGKCLGNDNPMRRPGASNYIKRDKYGQFISK
jgi:group I intron endonuclease